MIFYGNQYIVPGFLILSRSAFWFIGSADLSGFSPYQEIYFSIEHCIYFYLYLSTVFIRVSRVEETVTRVEETVTRVVRDMYDLMFYVEEH